MQVQPLLAQLKGHLSLHHVEPFVLIQVQVQGRAARPQMRVLHNEQPAAGFIGSHFDGKGTRGHPERMAEAVLTVANNMQSAWSWQRRSLGACLTYKKIMQTRSRRRRSDSFEKGTALHNASFTDGMWGEETAGSIVERQPLSKQDFCKPLNERLYRLDSSTATPYFSSSTLETLPPFSKSVIAAGSATCFDSVE
jgi:hypothetical protein